MINPELALLIAVSLIIGALLLRRKEQREKAFNRQIELNMWWRNAMQEAKYPPTTNDYDGYGRYELPRRYGLSNCPDELRERYINWMQTGGDDEI